MAAHTPGPWGFDETTLSICRGLVSVEDVQAFSVTPAASLFYAIAYVPCDVARDKQEANARLIAAAPELLAALRDAVAALGGIHSDKVPDSARVAIVKAEGT